MEKERTGSSGSRNTIVFLKKLHLFFGNQKILFKFKYGKKGGEVIYSFYISIPFQGLFFYDPNCFSQLPLESYENSNRIQRKVILLSVPKLTSILQLKLRLKHQLFSF